MNDASQKRLLAEQLRGWFEGQTKYTSIKDLSEALGLSESSMRDAKLLQLASFPALDSPFFTAMAAEPPQSRPSIGKDPDPSIPPMKQPTSKTTAPSSSATSANATSAGSQSSLPYSAYMATALTGLDRSARIGVIFISDCVARICSKHHIALYEPRKATDPVHNATIADHRVYLLDREKVTRSDLVIVLCEHPSFGAGQEIEIAGNATVPLVLLAMEDKKVSRMVTGTPVYKQVVHFTDPDDLERGLSQVLQGLKPLIEERRNKMLATPVPEDLGARVRELRKNLRLDQEELAREVGVSEQFVKNLEENQSDVTNLSLIQLASLCRVLQVPHYVLLGESDVDGEAIPAAYLRWGRARELSTARVREVLNFAAREKPGRDGAALTEQDLDALLARRKEYEDELGDTQP